MTLQEQALYVALLSAMDWEFEFADDHRVYAQGRDRLAWAAKLQRRIDPDFEIWNAYVPLSRKVWV